MATLPCQKNPFPKYETDAPGRESRIRYLTADDTGQIATASVFNSLSTGNERYVSVYGGPDEDYSLRWQRYLFTDYDLFDHRVISMSFSSGKGEMLGVITTADKTGNPDPKITLFWFRSSDGASLSIKTFYV